MPIRIKKGEKYFGHLSPNLDTLAQQKRCINMKKYRARKVGTSDQNDQKFRAVRDGIYKQNYDLLLALGAALDSISGWCHQRIDITFGLDFRPAFFQEQRCFGRA